jgi:hypothetical protein
MDRELAASRSGFWSAQELVFAAASYLSLSNTKEDPRLRDARDLLVNTISEAGRFPTELSLHTDPSGYSLDISGAEVLRAFAELLEEVDAPVTPGLMHAFLRFFRDTAVPMAPGDLPVGWAHAFNADPPKAFQWSTALTVLALDRVARMLDEDINRRVRRHFSTRPPNEIGRLKLPDLLCPDYGLARWRAKGKGTGQPIAFQLERMRAHVLDAPPLPTYQSDLCSLVLFGPPGTGKTTFLEALAASCGTHLLEVTPSDIMVEGEGALERRTRAVFRALALLKSSVILFDEFDPVVRARRLDAGHVSTFSFLTPGMLPKLKRLHDSAVRRRVAFALVTNEIDSLDGAAIRTGRFDARIGVYPPDLLSRVGRFLNELCQTSADLVATLASTDTELSARLLEMIARSGGLGMSYLGRPGVFSRAKHPRPGSPMAYAHDGESAPEWSVPDAEFGDLLQERRTDVGKRERDEWAWVVGRDPGPSPKRANRSDVRRGCDPASGPALASARLLRRSTL